MTYNSHLGGRVSVGLAGFELELNLILKARDKVCELCDKVRPAQDEFLIDV